MREPSPTPLMHRPRAPRVGDDRDLDRGLPLATADVLDDRRGRRPPRPEVPIAVVARGVLRHLQQQPMDPSDVVVRHVRKQMMRQVVVRGVRREQRDGEPPAVPAAAGAPGVVREQTRVIGNITSSTETLDRWCRTAPTRRARAHGASPTRPQPRSPQPRTRSARRSRPAAPPASSATRGC